MRAILIDPQTKSITEVDYTGDFRNIYDHIGAECFDCVSLGDRERNTIFVDDNGLNNGAVHRIGMFRFHGDNPAYLAGKALILATNREGDSIATGLTLDDVRGRVDFGLPVRFAGLMLFVGEKETYTID